MFFLVTGYPNTSIVASSRHQSCFQPQQNPSANPSAQMAPPIPALDPTPATGLRCRGTVGPSPQDCGHGGVPEGGTEIHNDYVVVLKKIKKRVGRQHAKKKHGKEENQDFR